MQPVLCRLKLDRTSILYELGGKRIHPVGNVDKPFQLSNQYVPDRIYKFYYGQDVPYFFTEPIREVRNTRACRNR